MIDRRYLLTSALGAVILPDTIRGLRAKVSPRHSFEPGAIWPDLNDKPINAHGGGVLLYDRRYYWFGEHKVAGEFGNTAQVGVHVYSSTDLYNWKDEGVALRVVDDANSEITRGCVIERPKVLFNHKTNMFVMWFHLELKGQGYKAARVGLAVSKTPKGPYHYISSVRPNAGTWPVNIVDEDKRESPENYLQRDYLGGQMARDMTLFQDDDGKAYLAASSEENRTLHISLLTDDFLSFSNIWFRALPGGDNEAPAIFKTNGRYYMFTSGLTGWAPNGARSWSAQSLLGPWTALGNPVRGTDIERATTFGGQSTFVLPYKGGFVFMADRWNPKNAIDGRYLWLPVEWEDDKPVLHWQQSWTLDKI